MFGEYNYIIVPFITIILTQIIKFIIESIQNKKLIWGRLFNGSGGMPSSHNAFVFSLTTLIGINEGITSTFFAISLIFSLIIMYDSMVLRMETENQAITINKLVDNLIKGDTKKSYNILKEEIGHKPIEVFCGILFGISIGIIFSI
ncbi:MAG: divergent PAP2 family protein [Bacilli bacterium]|nr:divergent PAP2 family protein [Bacilli bacterium]